MKKVYLLAVCFLIGLNSFSQISLSATLGTTGPTSYSSLKAAFDAVNLGTHKGVITITINGSTTETATAVLMASGVGGSSYTSLSIKPTGGVASFINGNISGPLIDLDGADNVTIDGLNTGGNALTIANTSNSNLTATSTIRFFDDATANTVTNVSILGASTSATLGTVLFGSGATVTGNDNNVISNCNIAEASGNFPVNAIYSEGTATAGQENSGITISNNNISNYFNPGLSTAGVLVGVGNTDWTITGNKFFQTSNRTFTTGSPHRAIQVVGGNNYAINNNIIGFSAANGTGTYALDGAVTSRFLAIDLSVGTTVASNVQNNTISNFSFITSNNASSATGIWCAINVAGGNVNIGTVTGNTIGSTTGTGNININPTVAGTLVVGITSSSTGIINIANNTIGSIDLLPSGVFSGNFSGIQAGTAASGTYTITNNIIGNSTANNIKIGVLNTTTGNGTLRGIMNINAGTITITNNTIRNLTHNSNNILATFRGIECQQGTANITGNTITNLTANGTAASALTPEGVGIAMTTLPLAGLVIDQNTISNLNVINSTPTAGPVVLGIYLSSAVSGVTVTRNKIFGFTNAGTALNETSVNMPPIIGGIYCRDAAAANPNILIANNMISFGNAQTTNTSIIGIWNVAASANGLTMKVYYNTVNIEGTSTSGTHPSFCYYRGDFTAANATPTIDLKNNLFTNTRTGGTGKHYAIANAFGNATSNAGGWGVNASDNNILNANPLTIGYWSGDQTFAGWQTSSASDAHSLSGTAITYTNSISDLHLVTTANAGVDGKAAPLAAVTVDIDNNTRNASTPDIGADEFTYNGSVPIVFEYFKGKKQSTGNLLNWKGSCSSSSVIFEIERSVDAKTFVSIGSISATQSRCSQPFDFIDNTSKFGTNYYRLKMKEADGKISYSIIIAIINKETGFEIVSMMPTLVDRGTATLNVSTAQNTNLSVVITDAYGRNISKQNLVLSAGSNTINLNLSNLSSGTYQLTAYTTEGGFKTIQFVKK